MCCQATGLSTPGFHKVMRGMMAASWEQNPFNYVFMAVWSLFFFFYKVKNKESTMLLHLLFHHQTSLSYFDSCAVGISATANLCGFAFCGPWFFLLAREARDRKEARGGGAGEAAALAASRRTGSGVGDREPDSRLGCQVTSQKHCRLTGCKVAYYCFSFPQYSHLSLCLPTTGPVWTRQLSTSRCRSTACTATMTPHRYVFKVLQKHEESKCQSHIVFWRNARSALQIGNSASPFTAFQRVLFWTSVLAAQLFAHNLTRPNTSDMSR